MKDDRGSPDWPRTVAGAPPLREEGIEAALERKRQLNRRPKRLESRGSPPDGGRGRGQALACGEPPEGRAGWTLKLLADRLVEWEIVESISPVVWGMLVHSSASAEFVCRWKTCWKSRQYADNEVLVCLDETSKQQVKETRRPRPSGAGSYDYEYEPG